MFARKGSVVRTGPDDDEPRPDSPRWHSNRNGIAEQRDDALLARLQSKQLVVDANEHTFSVAGHAGLKDTWRSLGPAPSTNAAYEHWHIPARTCGAETLTAAQVGRFPAALHKTLAKKQGWQCLGPETGQSVREPDIDARHELDDGTTMSTREHLAMQLDAHAHHVRAGEYRTGRIIAADGEVWRETTNDSDIVARVHPRGATKLIVTKED